MAAAQRNPRRATAQDSVSLLHNVRAKRSPDSTILADSDSSNSPSSLQPLGKGRSSGESSNADLWFENRNTEANTDIKSFADNDPPFFMRNRSSSQSPPDGQRQHLQPAVPLGAVPTGLAHMNTDGSSTEDYRGVIDDLTIENKKLKKRLKKYEKLHDAHLRDEKLFEVRFHGLPPDKKSELEATLQKFAASLGNNRYPANGYDGLVPSSLHKNASPAPNTDSAYASNSASGAGSSGRSAIETRSGVSSGQTARRDNIIHSYLHHIPQGLLPQSNPTNMTERAKQKLVVRRLEQLFAGKGAALHGHQHQQQQQDISIASAGQPARQEGVREAHILSEEGEKQVESADTTQGKVSPFSPSRQGDGKSPEQAAPSQRPEGEQRPTRPLDLDPHRAQVPADNLRYIRHLGYADPGSPSTPDEGQGWVYLNLLINMAQLHTINVTTDFVRKAVVTRSSNFEVSSDGSKVRWKGSSSNTPGSSMGDGSSSGHRVAGTSEGESPRKRPKLAHQESYRSQMSHTENKLVYTPMFWNRSSTDGIDSTSEEDESMSTPGHTRTAGDSSALTSTGVQTTTVSRKRQKADGPIIFYQNASFCTDLSGDPTAQYNRNAPLYSPTTEVALGELQAKSSGPIAEKRGPLAYTSELPSPMDLNDNPIPESMELSFPTPCHAAEQTDPMQPLDMEVSGIGGVWPADNFAIQVESRHIKRNQGGKPQQAHRQYLSTRFATLWPKSASTSAPPPLPTVSKHVLKSVRRDLPPSELPPALCFVSQSDDYESEIEGDDTSDSPVSDNGSVPSVNPQPVQLHYSRSDEGYDDYDDDMDDDESDGSVDMLAAARAMDPEAIRLQEREYDANMAERLAEEIPAGSSAATAGGGSGANSPAHGLTGEEYRRALAEHRNRRSMMRRSATADSMKVMVPVDSEDEDEDEDVEMDDVAS